MKNKLGIITLIISLTYMLLGLPAQVIEIWKTHSVKNISILMFILLMVQSLFWIAYGKQRNDKFIIIANTFGALFATMIVIEYLMFR